MLLFVRCCCLCDVVVVVINTKMCAMNNEGRIMTEMGGVFLMVGLQVDNLDHPSHYTD